MRPTLQRYLRSWIISVLGLSALTRPYLILQYLWSVVMSVSVAADAVKLQLLES